MTAYAVSPTGTVTRYPGANRIRKNDDGTHDLKNSDNDTFIARVPANHIVTFDRPGVEVKGVCDPVSAEAALDIVARGIRSYKPVSKWTNVFENLKTIKRELQSFDARGNGWSS